MRELCPNHHAFGWNNYVDDDHVAIDKDVIEDFMDHLNTVEETIQFTVEVESGDKTPPFVDVE